MMMDADSWHEIWSTLQRHPLRTKLTAFGVFWGVFMLVLLLAAGDGLERGAAERFNWVSNTVFVWSQATSKPYAGLAADRQIEFNNDDMTAVSELPELRVLAPRMRVENHSDNAVTLERGNSSVAFPVWGDHPDFMKSRPMQLEAGRFINEIDMQQRRKVVVIGRAVRDQLFDADETVIGSYLRIDRIPFMVVGQFTSFATGEQAISELQISHVPMTTAQQVFNHPNRVDWLGAVPEDGYSAAELEESIKQLLRARHRISPDDAKAIGSFNLEREFKKYQALFSAIAVFSWVVAIGTIAAGMVGVANIMMIVVRERTREIGIRKSLGAQPASIIGMIMMEALVLAGIAGYVGLLSGVIVVESISALMTRFGAQSEYFTNPYVDLSVALSALLVLAITGLIAGLIPGMKAARIDPVAALRNE